MRVPDIHHMLCKRIKRKYFENAIGTCLWPLFDPLQEIHPADANEESCNCHFSFQVVKVDFGIWILHPLQKIHYSWECTLAPLVMQSISLQTVISPWRTTLKWSLSRKMCISLSVSRASCNSFKFFTFAGHHSVSPILLQRRHFSYPSLFCLCFSRWCHMIWKITSMQCGHLFSLNLHH